MKRDDFTIRNDKDWKKIHKSIFGDNIPKNYQWTDTDDIINILNKIGNIEASNHMLFANGGGLDLNGATKSHEKNCIELLTGISYIVKPKSLTFENIDKDFEWNYFRLEVDSLTPSGIYNGLMTNNYVEEIVELTPLEYIDRCYWDEQEYDDEKLPPTARLIIRILKGSLVIFKKTSIYNSIPSTYDGRHDKLGVNGFKEQIQNAHKYIQQEK